MHREPFQTSRLTRGDNPFHQLELSSQLDKYFDGNLFGYGTERIKDGFGMEIYSPDREWVDRDHPYDPETKWQHERHLHQLFWNPDCDHMLILSGDVGIGKSTLVNHYLRYFCPTHNERDFPHKLLVLVDAPGLGDYNQCVPNLHYKLKKSIESAFRLAGSPLRVSNTKAVGQWIVEAFHAIADKRATHESPYKFIVLVLDNLDQCFPGVQSRWCARTAGLRGDSIRVFGGSWSW